MIAVDWGGLLVRAFLGAALLVTVYLLVRAGLKVWGG